MATSDQGKERSITRLSLIVALLGVLTGPMIQMFNTYIERDAKRFELIQKPRYEAYSSFMSALGSSFRAAKRGDQSTTYSELKKLEREYYNIDAMGRLLSSHGDRQKDIWPLYSEFLRFCEITLNRASKGKMDDNSTNNSFETLRTKMQDLLRDYLL